MAIFEHQDKNIIGLEVLIKSEIRKNKTGRIIGKEYIAALAEEKYLIEFDDGTKGFYALRDFKII